MSVQTFGRCAVVLSLAVFVAGCGGGANKKPVAANLGNECKWHRSSCLYEAHTSRESGTTQNRKPNA